jgi:hypothetical protein
MVSGSAAGAAGAATGAGAAAATGAGASIITMASSPMSPSMSIVAKKKSDSDEVTKIFQQNNGLCDQKLSQPPLVTPLDRGWY